MEKEITLIKNKSKEKVKLQLEIEFDEPIIEIKDVLNNVLRGLEERAYAMGIAPENEAAITCKIKVKYLERIEMIQQYFQPIM